MLSDIKLRVQNGRVQMTQMGQKSIRFASRIIQNQASIHFDVDMKDIPHMDGFFSSTCDPYFIVYDGNRDGRTRGKINPNGGDLSLFVSSVNRNTKNWRTHWWGRNTQNSIKVNKFSKLKWVTNTDLQFRFRFSFFDHDKDGTDDFIGADKKDWDLHEKPHLGFDFDLRVLKMCRTKHGKYYFETKTRSSKPIDCTAYQPIKLHRKVKGLFGSTLKQKGDVEVRYDLVVRGVRAWSSRMSLFHASIMPLKLQEYHSYRSLIPCKKISARMIVTKNLTRASRSNTGTA